jgi:hypothetical protein
MGSSDAPKTTAIAAESELAQVADELMTAHRVMHGSTSAVGLDIAMSVLDVSQYLPGISRVRDLSKALAMLDAVMSPRWEMRYYSFDSRWAPDQEMASMRNGSGDDCSIVFHAIGAFVRGFDHESPMSPYRVAPMQLWPGMLDGLPRELQQIATETAFSDPEGTLRATACLWRLKSDSQWACGNAVLPPDAGDDPDGSTFLFDLPCDDRPEAYQRFAEEYYEVEVNLQAIGHVYALRALTPDLVAALNPNVSVADLEQDRQAIGYPAPVN